MTTEKEITARVKAFTNHGIGTYRILVEADGDILVYDSIAGHFTRCHALTPAQIKRLRKLAGWSR